MSCTAACKPAARACVCGVLLVCSCREMHTGFEVGHGGVQVRQSEGTRPGPGQEAFLKAMAELRPDLCVTAAYGNILPYAFLVVPRCGTLNVHPSLLPRYRGAAPVQRALQARHNRAYLLRWSCRHPGSAQLSCVAYSVAACCWQARRPARGMRAAGTADTTAVSLCATLCRMAWRRRGSPWKPWCATLCRMAWRRRGSP